MSAISDRPRVIHIYCNVIDNLGDIGACWRLARQLSAEYAQCAHVWVNDWSAARRMIGNALPEQNHELSVVEGVTVHAWNPPGSAADDGRRMTGARHPSPVVDHLPRPPHDRTGDVLIEGFGCTLPDATLAQLAARTIKPLWINLEYFSAEDWVESHHRQSGVISSSNARRWFFIPGVQAHSAGMLRERGLIAERDGWLAQHRAQYSDGADRQPQPTTLLCFAYAHAPYAELLAALAATNNSSLELWLCGEQSQSAFAQVDVEAVPHISMQNLPFVGQPEFDRLLWVCDIAFVRGEDSFARALWSGKPFIWHIYPQAENAHHPKLMAWLAHYTRGFPGALRDALVDMHGAWNAVEGAPPLRAAWMRLMRHWAGWQARSLQRSNELAQSVDLAQRLMDFIASLE